MELPDKPLTVDVSFVVDFMSEEELSFQRSGNSSLSFLNADAVYLATFASLRLWHRLDQSRFYASSAGGNCPTSEVRHIKRRK